MGFVLALFLAVAAGVAAYFGTWNFLSATAGFAQSLSPELEDVINAAAIGAGVVAWSSTTAVVLAIGNLRDALRHGEAEHRSFRLTRDN